MKNVYPFPSFNSSDDVDDDKLFNSIHANAIARKKNAEIGRIMFTVGLGLCSMSAIGVVALWVTVSTPKQEPTLNISAERMQEKASQKEWLDAIQKVDHTSDINPGEANPGSRQVLAANYGTKVVLPNLRQQLADPRHPCGQGAETLESCAFRAEKDNVDREVLEASQGIKFAVFRKNPLTNKWEFRRVMDELQMQDNGDFRRWGLDAAIAPFVYSPNPDPFAINAARNKVLTDRVQRVGREGHTHAASEIKRINSVLPEVEPETKKEE